MLLKVKPATYEEETRPAGAVAQDAFLRGNAQRQAEMFGDLLSILLDRGAINLRDFYQITLVHVESAQ